MFCDSVCLLMVLWYFYTVVTMASKSGHIENSQENSDSEQNNVSKNRDGSGVLCPVTWKTGTVSHALL